MLATAAASLALFAPVVVHDGQERHPLASVDRGAPPTRFRPTKAASGCSTGSTTATRTRTAASSGPAGTRERCPASELERRDGRPVVYAAHGSHASYFHAGIRDRLWPDPNDEADGRGRVTPPRQLEEVTRSEPPWMRDASPWGGSRASRWVPPEQDSPPGPAFQPARWDAHRFAADARACQADCNQVGECDAPEKAMTASAVGLLAAAALLTLRRRLEPPGDATG